MEEKWKQMLELLQPAGDTFVQIRIHTTWPRCSWERWSHPIFKKKISPSFALSRVLWSVGAPSEEHFDTRYCVTPLSGAELKLPIKKQEPGANQTEQAMMWFFFLVERWAGWQPVGWLVSLPSCSLCESHNHCNSCKCLLQPLFMKQSH